MIWPGCKLFSRQSPPEPQISVGSFFFQYYVHETCSGPLGRTGHLWILFFQRRWKWHYAQYLQSATTSELVRVGPSPPRPPRYSNNDKAKDRDAQKARMELHLRSQAWRTLARMAGGSCLTFAFANWLKKFWHSPPTGHGRWRLKVRVGCLFCNPPTCKHKRDDVACPRSFDRTENHMDERSMLPGAHRISGRTTTQFVFVFTRQSVPVFVKDPFHKVKFQMFACCAWDFRNVHECFFCRDIWPRPACKSISSWCLPKIPGLFWNIRGRLFRALPRHFLPFGNCRRSLGNLGRTEHQWMLMCKPRITGTNKHQFVLCVCSGCLGRLKHQWVLGACSGSVGRHKHQALPGFCSGSLGRTKHLWFFHLFKTLVCLVFVQDLWAELSINVFGACSRSLASLNISLFLACSGSMAQLGIHGRLVLDPSDEQSTNWYLCLFRIFGLIYAWSRRCGLIRTPGPKWALIDA